MNYLINIQTDIGESLKHTIVASPLIQYNEKANVFRITVMNGSTPVNLDTVDAYFIRGDNTTVKLPSEACVASANVASVTLTDVCYAITGPAVLTVNNIDTQNDVTTCIGRFECVVARASTDSIVDPGEIIPSVNNLMNQIENAVASIPEDYSQMSQDVTEIKAVIEDMPIEPGLNVGSIQSKAFTDDHDRSYVSKADGIGSFAVGGNALAIGNYSHSDGYGTFAFAGGHAEGSGDLMFHVSITTLGTSTSTLFSYENLDRYALHTTDIGKYLVIIDGTLSGSLAYRKITNIDPNAMRITLESGFSAILNQTEAVITLSGSIDVGSHAEGYATLAIGSGSHAEGYSTRVTGNYSHCEGYNTVASAMRCHAEGRSTEALANDCHTEGMYTIANSACQHVEGKYNVADTQGTYAHIVGNGTTRNNRSNAYTLDWSGNGTYAGNVKANGGSLILHGANGDVTLTAEILARIIADYSA